MQTIRADRASRTPTNTNRPNITYAPTKKDKPQYTSPGSGYTPGGDSYKNYSDEDQQTIFNQAGGKKAFQNQVANIEQKYGRSADVQNYLNRARQFQNAQLLGARPSNVGGIERLNFTTPGMPVMRDAQGLSLIHI